MDLSQEGPDQNFEYSINAGNQILITFTFIQLFDPRLMCGAMVGCVVCEGYAFFIKKCTST